MEVVSMPFSFWFRIFEYEFKRRTGISWSEASGEMDVAHSYYDTRITPTGAVLAEIEHLDLTDLTKEPMLGVG
jgi:hypothetical protein